MADLPPVARLLSQRRSTLTDYPYPLRPGLHVYLRLPDDLTGTEAERLAEFVRALAREEEETSG